MTKSPTLNDDNNILTALRNKQEKYFEILYVQNYPIVRKFILNNSGSENDAMDIFQETMIVLLKNISEENFQLTASLSTYTCAISRNLWLKDLRNTKHFRNTQSLDFVSETDFITSQDEEQKPLDKLMKQISEHCQKLINRIFFQNKKISEIEKEFNYSNTHTAQNQKYKCLKKLKEEAFKK
ncbi:MAG: sigma-70 family RNA polymerase sigma factor [Bacteroidia bacterium]